MAKKKARPKAREDLEGSTRNQRMVLRSVPVASSGLVGFTTCAVALWSSCGRAAMPTTMTVTEASRATTTILRWVARSAVIIEEFLDMTGSPGEARLLSVDHKSGGRSKRFNPVRQKCSGEIRY